MVTAGERPGLNEFIGEGDGKAPTISLGVAICPQEQARVPSMTLAEAIGEGNEESREVDTFKLPANPPMPPEDICEEALRLLNSEEPNSKEPALLVIEELTDEELFLWTMDALVSGL